MGRQLVGILFFLCATLLGGGLFAQSDLTVRAADGSATAALSLDDLQALPQHDVVTANEFVDGVKTFRGPLVRDLLQKYGGAKAVTATLTAANDYQIDVAVKEFYDYDAILALSMDGDALSSRDKGPIWMIYPMSDHAELRDPVYNSRLIWQVVRIEYR